MRHTTKLKSAVVRDRAVARKKNTAMRAGNHDAGITHQWRRRAFRTRAPRCKTQPQQERYDSYNNKSQFGHIRLCWSQSGPPEHHFNDKAATDIGQQEHRESGKSAIECRTSTPSISASTKQQDRED